MQVRKRIGLVLGGALAIAGLAAEAQEAYRLRPGDVLQIEVIEDPSLNRQVLVSPDGRVTLPLAGSVQAGGRTVEQVQAELASRLAPNFAVEPNVFVGISSVFEEPVLPTTPLEPATIDVYFVGEAGTQGIVTVEPGTTLLQAIAQAGGFSPFAATKRIQLRRTDPTTLQETVYTLNYNEIQRGTSRAGATILADGDVILVPQRGLFE